MRRLILAAAAASLLAGCATQGPVHRFGYTSGEVFPAGRASLTFFGGGKARVTYQLDRVRLVDTPIPTMAQLRSADLRPILSSGLGNLIRQHRGIRCYPTRSGFAECYVPDQHGRWLNLSDEIVKTGDAVYL